MLKVYVIFFVKAVKKNNHYSQSSFGKSYLGFLLRFGVFLKIKLMELSCLQKFLWLLSLLCVFNKNVFEGTLCFMPQAAGGSSETQSFCWSREVASLCGDVSAAPLFAM